MCRCGCTNLKNRKTTLCKMCKSLGCSVFQRLTSTRTANGSFPNSSALRFANSAKGCPLDANCQYPNPFRDMARETGLSLAVNTCGSDWRILCSSSVFSGSLAIRANRGSSAIIACSDALKATECTHSALGRRSAVLWEASADIKNDTL